MQKLKITETGWTGFTGDFGGVQFKGGISVEVVPPALARRLANLVRCQLEDGVNPSDSQRVIDYAATPASANMNDKVESAVNPVKTAKLYGKQELEALADSGGMAALRPIGAALGVKSNAIAKLIDLILRAQNKVTQPSSDLGLLGSSVQPSAFIIDGKEFTLGDVVRTAFDDSGMATSEWNDQPAEARESLIAAAVVKLGAVGKVAVAEIVKVDTDPTPQVAAPVVAAEQAAAPAQVPADTAQPTGEQPAAQPTGEQSAAEAPVKE